MIFDLHCHTKNSPDGRDDIDAVVGAAIGLGIDVLALTEHCDAMEGYPFPYFYGLDLQIVSIDEKKIRADFFAARERYKGKIRLLYGVELGEAQLNPREMFEYTARQGFDFIIGSSHVLSGDLDLCENDYSVRSSAQVLEHYFSDILNMVKTGGIDALGHLEYPVRYLRRDGEFQGSLLPFREQIREILRVCAVKGIALEINGKGGAPKLEPFIIRDYLELSGPYLTYGSDAHSVSRLLSGREGALALAENCGAKYFVYFEGRRPFTIKI